MEVQLEMPEVAIRTAEVSDIVLEWSIDEDGYNMLTDYLGRYINSSGDAKGDVVIDRQNGYMLGEDVDKEGLANRWFRKMAKTFSGYRRVMHSYNLHFGDRKHRDNIHGIQDINMELLFELHIDEMSREAGYDIDCESGRRILANIGERRVGRNDMRWFDPSPNYDLRNGSDWDRADSSAALKQEIQAFNQVSHWPPKDQDGKRVQRGRKVKPYNGWRKHGIYPDVSKKERPGFWVNVFYACEDHERLEAFNDGEWQALDIIARCKINFYDSIGGGEPTLAYTEDVETGWTGGYESDSGKEDQKAVEQEKLDELRHQVEAAGAIWPTNPDVEYVGDIPY